MSTYLHTRAVLLAGFLQGSTLSAPQHMMSVSRRAPLCLEYVPCFPEISQGFQPSKVQTLQGHVTA